MKKKSVTLLSSLALLALTTLSSCTSPPSTTHTSKSSQGIVLAPTHNNFVLSVDHIDPQIKGAKTFEKSLESFEEHNSSEAFSKTLSAYNPIFKQQCIAHTRELFNNIRHLYLIEKTYGAHSSTYQKHTDIIHLNATNLYNIFLTTAKCIKYSPTLKETYRLAQRDTKTLVKYLISSNSSNNNSLKNTIHVLNTCLIEPITKYNTPLPFMPPEPQTISSPHHCITSIDATYPQYICESIYSTVHLNDMRSKRYELGELVYYYTHFLNHHRYCFEQFDTSFILIKHQTDFMRAPPPQIILKEKHYKDLEKTYQTEYKNTIQQYPTIILYNLLYDIDYLHTLYTATQDTKLNTKYIDYMSQQFKFYTNYKDKQNQLLILYNQFLKQKKLNYTPLELPSPHPQTKQLAINCKYELNKLFTDFPNTKHIANLQNITTYLNKFIDE